MYIGALAHATQTTPKALRLYESLGLLQGVQRQGAYRIYAERHVQQVMLIRRAQALGFKLAELKTVLARQGGEPDWSQVAAYLRQKQAALRQDIARLQQLDADIGQVLVELAPCAATPAVAGTPPAVCAALPA